MDYAEIAKYAAMAAFLIAATVTDIRTLTIPDWITLPGVIAGVVTSLLVVAPPLWENYPVTGSVLGGLVSFLTLWNVRVWGTIAFRREAMGFGDVTFAGMIGSFLGWQVTNLCFAFAVLSGLVILLTLRLCRIGDGAYPFGPFLALGALLAAFSWQAVREISPLWFPEGFLAPLSVGVVAAGFLLFSLLFPWPEEESEGAT